jgi:DNA-directed RNA polymerase subunit RPC12/RpoP
MSEQPAEERLYEAVCPHCHKEFVGELLAGPTAQQAGFKCPHCKLFVPHARSQQEADAPATSS